MNFIGGGGGDSGDDPIIGSLIDTDFYKILMCQFVLRNKPDTKVRFSLLNR